MRFLTLSSTPKSWENCTAEVFLPCQGSVTGIGVHRIKAHDSDEELPCAQVLFWALERAASRARDNLGNKQFPDRILDSYARKMPQI